MKDTSFHNPSYYNRGKIEVWDFIRDQQLNYHLGNVIKYVCRAGNKRTVGNPDGDPTEDLTKAIHYLANELEHVTNDHARYTSHISEQPSKGIQEDVLDWELTRSGTAD